MRSADGHCYRCYTTDKTRKNSTFSAITYREIITWHGQTRVNKKRKGKKKKKPVQARLMQHADLGRCPILAGTLDLLVSGFIQARISNSEINTKGSTLILSLPTSFF